MTVEIREIRVEEAERVADVVRRGFRDVAERFGFCHERCPSFPAHITEGTIRKEFEDGTRFFVIEENGDAAGCVGMKIEGEKFWMVRLAVVPEYRHQNYGRALTEHVEREAWRMNFKKVDIALVAENTRLSNWYHRLGYKDRETQDYDHHLPNTEAYPYTVAYMCKEASHG